MLYTPPVHTLSAFGTSCKNYGSQARAWLYWYCHTVGMSMFLTLPKNRPTNIGIDVSSTAHYPRQLQQASKLLYYLVQTKGIAPYNVCMDLTFFPFDH